MMGRRIKVEMSLDGTRPMHPALTRPGDYCGPITGFIGKLPTVFFLKPNSHDKAATRRARCIQHVTSPPYTFVEEKDGSLSIKEIINDMSIHNGRRVSDGWRGFLTKGEWHL